MVHRRYMVASLSPQQIGRPPRFLLYMSLVENTVGPWFKLFVFGELGLNNAGSRAARENFIHFIARQSD